MRRELIRWGFSGLVFLAMTATANAQLPHIPNMAQRSGLIGRFVPMVKTNLPPDPRRDTFFGTRYGDRPTAPMTNNMFNGGLFGSRLDPGCVSCSAPYFYGVPGRPSANSPDCLPAYRNPIVRTAASLFHPWKPVGHYYQEGCMVPIYDLDPLSPGPGPDLWPFYINGRGG